MRVSRHQPLDTAPRDGRYVLVFIRGNSEPLKAYWSVQLSGWVDISGRILRQAEAWRPVAEGGKN